MKIIYLDNASTTPVYKEVAIKVNEVNMEHYANPSSSHELGNKVKEMIEDSRKIVSREINASPEEIVFTSGATESINLAIQGLAKRSKKKKIIISSIEHSAVYECAKNLERYGYKIVEIPVDKEGLINLDILDKEIDSDTLLVSIIHVNNEFGTIQDIESIAKICERKKVILHVDSVQAFGKIKIDVRKNNIGLLSASGHKIGAPKGIGFLYVREDINLDPIIYGSGQQKGRRSGTENTSGIIGFAKAIEIANKIDKEKVKKNRDYFIANLEKIGGKINGRLDKRIYNNIHVSFLGVDSEMLVSFLSLHGIMCSTRSACTEKSEDENRVLKSIGLNKEQIRGSLRIVINEFITKKDIDYTIKVLEKGIGKFSFISKI